MKDLEHLEMYKVEGNPRENEQNSDEKHYWFEFPTTEFDSVGSNENPVMVTSVNLYSGSVDKILVSVQGSTTDRAITPNEMYKLKEYLLKEEETLSWYYDIDLENEFKKISKKACSRDVTDLVQMLWVDEIGVILEDLSSLLEKAYEKKVQKNKSFTYARGNFFGQQYIHVHTEEPFPWASLKAIAKREFRKGFVSVLFNEVTKKYPNEYIIFKRDNFRVVYHT